MTTRDFSETSYDDEVDRIEVRQGLLETRRWISWFLPCIGALVLSERFLLIPAARGVFLVSGILGAVLLFWLWHGALASVWPIPPHPYKMDGERSPLRWWLRVVGFAVDLCVRLVAGGALATMVQFAPAAVVRAGWTAEPWSILRFIGGDAPTIVLLAVEVLKDISVVSLLCAIVAHLSGRLACADHPQFAAGGEPSNRELLGVILVVAGVSFPLAANAAVCALQVWDQPRYAAHVIIQSTALIGAFLWFVISYRARWVRLRRR